MYTHLDNGNNIIDISHLKTSQQEKDSVSKIIDSISSGNNENFDLSAFHNSNMSDYDLMKGIIYDLTSMYNIDEVDAAYIIQSLSHGKELEDAEDDLEEVEEKIENTELEESTEFKELNLPPSLEGWD